MCPIKAFDRKDKIPSYLTTNILKLSAAIHLNFENKIFVDLNLFLELHKPLNGHWSMVLGWGVLRSSSSCPTSDALWPHHHFDSLTYKSTNSSNGLIYNLKSIDK